MKLLELKKEGRFNCIRRKGWHFHVGDLKWTVEEATTLGEKIEEESSDGEVCGYNPVDHLVLEIGKLFYDSRTSNAKVWLMATANFQTYKRCQMREPPLDKQWAFQALSVPSGGLGLSLRASR
ncbi:hypothetical protein RJT34_16753 [Clitoria ternatea]|uniref:SMAX1-like nucleotide binding domain-containing protein n=1 Tax=Clitoria ternatea TaxID=43366 RepID=A0AAN9J8Z8_CLITE